MQSYLQIEMEMAMRIDLFELSYLNKVIPFLRTTFGGFSESYFILSNLESLQISVHYSTSACLATIVSGIIFS